MSEETELPETYGETKIVLVPVHPFLVHVYWDLSPEHLTKIISRKRRSRSSKGPWPTLRFYDTTGSGDAEVQGDSFDVDVELQAMNWYVHIWKPARSYVVELGLRTAQGKFIPIARSDGARVAPASPSKSREERYLLVTGDYEQVEPVSPAPAAPLPQTREAPAHSAEACPNFSEPEGWFLGSEPWPVPDAPTSAIEEAHAVTIQSISSPFPGYRKAE